jgi:hypothetical protein
MKYLSSCRGVRSWFVLSGLNAPAIEYTSAALSVDKHEQADIDRLGPQRGVIRERRCDSVVRLFSGPTALSNSADFAAWSGWRPCRTCIPWPSRTPDEHPRSSGVRSAASMVLVERRQPGGKKPAQLTHALFSGPACALCKAAGGIDNDDFRMASLALHALCTRLFPESVMEDITPLASRSMMARSALPTRCAIHLRSLTRTSPNHLTWGSHGRLNF